jgi:sRNA-binding protein
MEPTKQENFRREMYAAHTAILAKLVELCPATFAPRGSSCWPLKVGIHEDIAALLPDATPRDISLFLLCYTRQRRYHRALKEGAPRLDLSGHPAGEVSASEAEHAIKMIARSDAKALAARPGKKAPATTPQALPKLAPSPIEVAEPEPETSVKAEKPTVVLAKPRPVVVVVKKRSVPKALAPMRKTA